MCKWLSLSYTIRQLGCLIVILTQTSARRMQHNITGRLSAAVSACSDCALAGACMHNCINALQVSKRVFRTHDSCLTPLRDASDCECQRQLGLSMPSCTTLLASRCFAYSTLGVRLALPVMLAPDGIGSRIGTLMMPLTSSCHWQGVASLEGWSYGVSPFP